MLPERQNYYDNNIMKSVEYILKLFKIARIATETYNNWNLIIVIKMTIIRILDMVIKLQTGKCRNQDT